MSNGLEGNRSGGTRASAAMAAPAGNRSRLRRLGSALRRRMVLFFAVLGATLCVGLAVTFLQVPRYTASAEVMPATGGSAQIDADARALGSPAMAASVAATLRLDRDPAFTAADRDDPIARLRALIGAGAPPAPAATGAEAGARAADRLRTGLAVGRPSGTLALTIAYTAAAPEAAARVANEYARQYAAGTGPLALIGGGPGARILSEAEPPRAPSSPRPLHDLLLALALGTVLSLAVAIATELRRGGFTSGGEIEERLGLQNLASVPLLASVLPDARSPIDAVVDASMSGFAEAFRSMLSAIHYARAARAQVVAVAAASPREGKSTIAACLARTVALGGGRVVLVDGDIRRGRPGWLAGEGRPGLVQVLRGEATLDEALVCDDASGAHVLPAAGGADQDSEPLAGPAMTALIEELRGRFALVLIDTPSLLGGGDAPALAAMAELVVVVVRWRATADRAVKAALATLRAANADVGGLVLSRVDMRKQVKYAHGDASFYYRQYSKYYS